MQDGKPQHMVEASPGRALPIALLGEDRVLIAGDASGTVSAYAWPRAFPAPAQYQVPTVTRAHAGAVGHMRPCGDDSLLVTVGEDGIILVWSLQVRLLR